jgi:hypothetical protein
MGSLSVLKQAFKRSDFEDKVFGRRGIIDGWYKKSERDFPKFLKRNPNLKWKNYNASSLTYGIGKPLYKIVDSLLDGINSLVPESINEGFTKYHIRLTKTPGWYGVWDKKGKQKFEGDRKFVTKHLKKLKTRMGNFQLKSLIDVATKRKGKNIEFDVVESVNERIDKRQAAETLKQLGGNKFIAMTGAKNFGFGSKGMVFKIGRNSKGVNYVRIDLRNDLYDMEFIQMRAGKEKIKSKIKGVYNDQLQKIFTKHTGMYTRL